MLSDTLSHIINCNELVNYNFKCCLVDNNKLPHKLNGELAKSNCETDFVSLQHIVDNYNQIPNIENYKGIGISIQYSNICAIDVDNCFKEPFDLFSGDERAKEIISMFKDYYVEFSFSGKGLRILFTNSVIDDYSNYYYIKNSQNHIEYYQPSNSYRYVTLTGKYIYRNEIKQINSLLFFHFLHKYMLKPVRKSQEISTIKENRSFEELMKLVKIRYFKNSIFQDLWFSNAPGSGKDESERDYHLLAEIFENITQDKDKLKQIFEQSQFFKTKDWKHKKKWEYNNYRYFNYLYKQLKGE